MGKYKKLFVQIMKFGFVGGSAFIIDFAVLWVLTEFLGVHYLTSNVVAFTVSVIYNYILIYKTKLLLPITFLLTYISP